MAEGVRVHETSPGRGRHRAVEAGDAPSRWFHGRVGRERGRVRKIAIVAPARKLFVALWRYVTRGVAPEGAALEEA